MTLLNIITIILSIFSLVVTTSALTIIVRVNRQIQATERRMHQRAIRESVREYWEEKE